MPRLFGRTARPVTDEACQEGLDNNSEDDVYHEQPSMLSAASGSNGNKATPTTTIPPSCCKRFFSELNPCLPNWFTTADTLGRKVDIPESFAPPSWSAFGWKLIATGLTSGTLVATWLDSDYPEFYLAYLTYWSLLLATLYQLCSLWNTIVASRTPQPPVAAGCFIRTTWALFTMAAHAEAMASILWWVLEYEPGETRITYYNLMPHLIIALVVWADGVVVNRIPVRWMHWYGFVLPLECGFILWSVIHSYANVGNPNKDDASGSDPDNDDAIYGSLAWKDNWQKSLIISVVAIFGLGPIIFLLLWLSSLYTIPCVCYKDKRKYMDSYKDDYHHQQRPTVDDVEEGSIFARWR
jgi:hypothetical protein